MTWWDDWTFSVRLDTIPIWHQWPLNIKAFPKDSSKKSDPGLPLSSDEDLPF